MKTLLFLFFLASANAFASRADNTVVLDETAVKNLRIETAVVEETAFEETVFAIGRIEVYPGRRAVLSSRIAGRVADVFIKPDHPIKKGDIALTVESRQPGNPPPRIELTAPISGLISESHVAPGQPVEPSDVLAEILDLDEVYAIAQVPEHLAGKLKPGQLARISVPAVPGEVFTAKIEHLGAVADRESGTIEAAFCVANPKLTLRPGMRAEFSIVVEQRENVFSIPRSALQGDVVSRYVYIKDFELANAFVKSPVITGRVNDQRVEILGGLFPADEVVTQGAYSLAFAGRGTLSLKEALDAAHGHEHAEDGSELKGTEKTTDPASAAKTSNPFWMIVSGILFLALLAVSFRKQKSTRDA